jgi:hypothetical protein
MSKSPSKVCQVKRRFLLILYVVSVCYAFWPVTTNGLAKDRPNSGPPEPREVTSRKGPLQASITQLSKFETAPFPYTAMVPGSGKPFFDTTADDGRLGHTTPYGHVFWQDTSYSDSRVLLHIPKGFSLRKPALMVVFFHGHGATLERDVLERQRVAAQLTASGLNAVLVAPQMAVDSADSSAGKFWQRGAFGRFTGEAAQAFGKMLGDKKAVRTFASMPVVIVAYSGGFQPAAWSLAHGGLGKRVKGVVLFDAMYGETAKFKDWISSNRSGFFVSAFLDGTRSRNEDLARSLAQQKIELRGEFDGPLKKGSVIFVAHDPAMSHRDFVSNAWVENPLADVLSRMKGFTR